MLKPNNKKLIILAIYIQALLNGRWKQRKLIVAQAKGESSNFNSKLAKSHYNVFGLRCSKYRKKYYEDCVNNYAKYSSVWFSIMDYFDLLNNYNFPKNITTSKEFAEQLKAKGYFEATTEGYIKMLNSWL